MDYGIRVGIIGTGFMGRVHAQAVRAIGAQVVGFVGSSPESARIASEAFAGARAADSLEQLIDMGVDVVHVCTPNALHADYARQAIEASLAVICEKPLTATVAEAVNLQLLASRHEIVTGVPFVYRFYPLVREIRRRISQDSDNRLWMLHGNYLQDWLADRSQTNWRVDPQQGGASRAFGDIGVHWCDLMEFVTGQRIVRLNAAMANAFEREGGAAQNLTEDGAVLMFETDHGALGSLAISQASAGRRNRLWFSFDGPETSYSFDQESPERAWVGSSDGAFVLDRHAASGRDGIARPFALPAGHPQGYQDCFNDFVADTYEAIEGESDDTRPDFTDGLRAAVLTRAFVEAVDQRQWVDVPSLEDVVADACLKPASAP